jgi:polyisoprenoid-binding protein YceI
MKHAFFLMLPLVALVACQSEITNKPAAEVSDAAPRSVAPGGQDPAGTTREDVIKHRSSINFVGAKVTRDHKGHFNDFDGWIEYQGPQPARISFEIDLSSVETDTPKLTEHLKTADFFDVARYPKATFVSSTVADAPAGSPPGTTHVLTGTLDLHGSQKEVRIPVTTERTAEGLRARSEFTINRHDWGISYRGMADDLIRDEVLMRLDLLFPPPPQS